MKSDSLQLISSLEQLDWFAQVGEPIPPSTSCVRVHTWADAYAACCRFLQEGDSRIDGVNAIRLNLRKHGFKDRYNRDWNQYVKEIRAVVDPLVVRKAAAVREAQELGSELFGAISCDITGACLEYEYADCIPTGHFVSILPWYLNGHFPCGWEGYFPKGKLILF